MVYYCLFGVFDPSEQLFSGFIQFNKTFVHELLNWIRNKFVSMGPFLESPGSFSGP